MANKKSTTKKKATTKKSTTSLAKTSVAKPASKPASSSSASTSTKTTTNKQPKTGLLIGLALAAIVAIVGVVVAVFCLNRPGSPSDPTEMLDYTTAFFIYDNGKYSLWNADGKRVSEDDYVNQSSFVAGYAMVKKDDQYGIIREDGKTSVDYGKYGTIASRGGLYLAEDGNTKEEFLITGNGTVLEKGTDLDADSPNSTAGFATVINDGKMKIYTYNGNLIAEAEVSGEEDPSMNSMNDFGIVHYNNKNWLFDSRNGELLATFDGERYSFDSVSDSRNMILLDDYEESEKYKLFANGKMYELNETKNYGLTDLDLVIGYDNYDELALLGDDYKVLRRVTTYIDLKDANNYAMEKDDGGVEIYHNGEKVKEFGDESEIAESSLLYDDLVAVKDGEKYKFYNLNGSVAFDKEFKNVDSLFDKNHHAIVSDDGDNYYLIGTNGNKIGEVTATKISYYTGGYEAMNKDDKYAILDKNGKQVTDYKYDSLYYRGIAEPRNIWTAKFEDGSTDVVDVENNKVVLEKAKTESFYENYFTVRNGDGDTEYYTYDGTLFYTKKK